MFARRNGGPTVSGPPDQSDNFIVDFNTIIAVATVVELGEQQLRDPVVALNEHGLLINRFDRFKRCLEGLGRSGISDIDRLSRCIIRCIS